jgi:hypothetical protein
MESAGRLAPSVRTPYFPLRTMSPIPDWLLMPETIVSPLWVME